MYAMNALKWRTDIWNWPKKRTTELKDVIPAIAVKIYTDDTTAVMEKTWFVNWFQKTWKQIGDYFHPKVWDIFGGAGRKVDRVDNKQLNVNFIWSVDMWYDAESFKNADMVDIEWISRTILIKWFDPISWLDTVQTNVYKEKISRWDTDSPQELLNDVYEDYFGSNFDEKLLETRSTVRKIMYNNSLSEVSEVPIYDILRKIHEWIYTLEALGVSSDKYPELNIEINDNKWHIYKVQKINWTFNFNIESDKFQDNWILD